MSKQAKKRPKPVERWAIYTPRGTFAASYRSERLAKRCCSEGWFHHRVRIVPVVAKAKRRKGAK